MPRPNVHAACAAAFAEADAIDVTLAWDLLRRRVANDDNECATGLASKVLEDGLGGLETVLEAEDDDEAMRACADAVCGAWARCAKAREASGGVVEDAAACASNLLDLMQLALTVRAYVACAESLQSLCRTSPEACHEILHGEGVRVLATALAWCVLDEDMSKGGLLKVVDTDLGCALVDLLTILAGADATKVVGDLKAEAPALIGVCLRAILLDERPQWTVPPLCKSGVHLLLRAPESYYAWLVANGSVPRLLTLLEPLVVLYLVERDPDAQEPDLQVAPCLGCVCGARRCSAEGRRGCDTVDLPAEGRRAVARGARGERRAGPRRRGVRRGRRGAAQAPRRPGAVRDAHLARRAHVQVPPEADAAPRGGPRAGAVRRRPGGVRAAGRDRRGGCSDWKEGCA